MRCKNRCKKEETRQFAKQRNRIFTFSLRFVGSMVVSHSCCGIISPSPLNLRSFNRIKKISEVNRRRGGYETPEYCSHCRIATIM
jgi:high-affinity Fe2+/Pb2+ permease